MEPLLLFPDPAPPALAQALDLSGYPWKAASSRRGAERIEPEDGWSGAIVCADVDPDGAFTLCRSLRKRDLPLEPAAARGSGDQLGELELREDLFDDFCVAPWQEPGAGGPAVPSVLADGSGHPAGSGRVRAAGPQPGDLPGGLVRPTAGPDVHGVRAAEVPRPPTRGRCSPGRCCCPGCGATSTTAGPAPWTCTSGGCGPSSGRSTPTSSRRCVRWGTASARAAGGLER